MPWKMCTSSHLYLWSVRKNNCFIQDAFYFIVRLNALGLLIMQAGLMASPAHLEKKDGE